MSMRVTQQSVNARVLTDLNRSQLAVTTASQQVSSGKRINQPSDDAVGTRQALRHRAVIDGVEQFQKNASQATGWLNTSDAAMQKVSDLMDRARELTVQGGNGATGAAGRAALAKEIDQIIGAVKDTANTKVGDAYVFSGTTTTTKPFDNASDAYHGDTNAVVRTIGEGVSVQVNTTGDTFGGFISTLRSISTHLTAGDTTSLSDVDLKALDTAADQLSSALATTGATQNRVDAADARLADIKQTTTDLLGDVESTDYAKALLELNTQQTAYQAALKAGATVMQTSLLDFLR